MAGHISVRPEFEQWVAEASPDVLTSELSLKPGDGAGGGSADRRQSDVGVKLNSEALAKLVPIAAWLASGFFRPTKRTEVIWVEGDSELEVRFVDVGMKTGAGVVLVDVPVRCDQTGPQVIKVVFVTGSTSFPAGAYGSTSRRPIGNELIVDAWGESLVAFAWDVLLTLTTQVAGAAGKDKRGSRFVPGELVAENAGLVIVPMERHRFFGSSGLLEGRAR